MLQLLGINQYYGGSHILRNLGFEARVGEVTVVLGRNGVGKTTLLKSLMGVVPVKTGSVLLDGADITHATPYERVRRGIGYVPQGREIFGRLTVEENLRMGLASKPAGARAQRRAVRAVPGAQADDQPARRRPVGRPTAAAGDRARAGRRPQAAAARRAHRRHPAEHHQGHRPRDPHAGRSQDDGHRAGASSTTTSRPNWPISTW